MVLRCKVPSDLTMPVFFFSSIEPYFKTRPMSELCIWDPGRWWGLSSDVSAGSAATRASCSNIFVSAKQKPSSSSSVQCPMCCCVIASLHYVVPGSSSSCQVPSDIPSDVHPHTLHSRHRQFNDPPDMERFLSFNEPHRIRYTSGEGICIHDQYIQVRYEFTTVEASIQFQGDLRRKDLVDFYDVDVVWSNLQSRTDSFGKVKGIGAIQRLKLWRDRYTTFHSLSVLANKTDNQYREYDIHHFDGELRNRDDRAKTLRLNVHGRRGSVPDETSSRRTFRIRQRVRSAGQASAASPELGPSYATTTLDIRYLSIQFTHKRGKRRERERDLKVTENRCCAVWKGKHSNVGHLQTTNGSSKPGPLPTAPTVNSTASRFLPITSSCPRRKSSPVEMPILAEPEALFKLVLSCVFLPGRHM